MAAILPDSKNFLQTQDAFLKQSLSEYSTFLNALPLLVEYYSKDFLNSSHDVNLHTVQEILGDDSPVKFNRIIDFPLYKATNLEGTEEDSEDVGTEAQIEGTAIVPPSNVMPRIDDLFIIPWYTRKAIFRVKTVKRSNLKGRTFYEIGYYLYSTMEEMGDIDKQVSKEYRVVGSPSAVNKSAIISVDKADLCFEIQKKVDYLVNNLSIFYNQYCEGYVYQESYDIWRWDECVHYFVSHNVLFERAVAYRNEFTIRNLEPTEYPDFYTAFQSSLYYAIENQDYSLMDGKQGAYLTGSYTDSLPGSFLRTVKVKATRYAQTDDVTTYHYYNVFGNIKEYLLDTTGTVEPSLKGAEQYFKLIKFYKENTDLDKIESYMKTIIPAGTIYDYYYLPTAIFIFKDFLKRIRTIYNFNN